MACGLADNVNVAALQLQGLLVCPELYLCVLQVSVCGFASGFSGFLQLPKRLGMLGVNECVTVSMVPCNKMASLPGNMPMSSISGQSLLHLWHLADTLI